MITITKDKIYNSNFSLRRTKSNSKLVDEIEVDDLIYLMNEHIELGDDVTFERLFDIIIYHKDFFNILFNSDMNGVEIEDFISDYEQDFVFITPHQEYKLRVSWAGIVYEINQEIELYDYPIFEAFGKIDNRIDGEDYSISLAFSSLSEFRSKRMFVDNTFEIQNSESYQNELETSFKVNYKPFTLVDLFGTILSEISHYGNPDERETARLENEVKSKQINDWIEEGTLYDNITEKFTQDEFSEDFSDTEDNYWNNLYPDSNKDLQSNVVVNKLEESSLNKQLQEAEEAEDYEKAAEIKKLIDSKKKIMTEKKIDLKEWSDFPQFFPEGVEDVFVSGVDYKGNSVNIGDRCIWTNSINSEEFIIESIRLNPTLRFWNNEKKEYVQAVNCVIINSFDDLNFDEHNWDSMHDCLYNASYDVSIGDGKTFTIDELKKIFLELPENLRLDANRWGMSDTPWRDNLFTWYKENKIIK